MHVHAAIFTQDDAEQEDIIAAGEKALLILYGGNVKNLDELRYSKLRSV